MVEIPLNENTERFMNSFPLPLDERENAATVKYKINSNSDQRITFDITQRFGNSKPIRGEEGMFNVTWEQFNQDDFLENSTTIKIKEVKDGW